MTFFLQQYALYPPFSLLPKVFKINKETAFRRSLFPIVRIIIYLIIKKSKMFVHGQKRGIYHWVGILSSQDPKRHKSQRFNWAFEFLSSPYGWVNKMQGGARRWQNNYSFTQQMCEGEWWLWECVEGGTRRPRLDGSAFAHPQLEMWEILLCVCT